MRKFLAAALAGVLLAAMLGCGASTSSTSSDGGPAAGATPAGSGGQPTEPAVIQVPSPEPADDGLKAHLATTVLDVGEQRVAFVLVTQKALVNAPSVQVAVAPAGGDAPASAITAHFNEWPYGVRGSYAATVDFPSAGQYLLTATVDDAAVMGSVDIPVEILADSPVPSLGEPALATDTKTLSDEVDLPQLTTAYTPDPELYRTSIADAVAAGRPAVIVFATPAFCTSPTCGPQVDTVSELRAAYPDTANYIHVELYDNPLEIQGNLDNAKLVSAADEWGFTQLPHWTNESWVFVVDGNGIIRHRFEGFASLSELETALADAAGL